MTARKVCQLVAVSCLLLASVFCLRPICAHAEEEKGLASPLAVFPLKHFEFKPVVDGTSVTHDFFIQNKGKAPLAIHKVKTG